MRVNKEFPVIPIGSKITFIDHNGKIQRNAEVRRVWYPKDGEWFSESEEIKHIGWCCSNPMEMFPQLLVKTIKYGLYTMYGSDLQSIISYTLPENER